MIHPVHRQRVFEARYEQGYRYLDRCGDALLILEDILSQDTHCVWLPEEATPTGARLMCPDLDTYVVFNASSLIIDQQVIGEAQFDFAAVATTALSTVVGRFDLQKMRRFGFRRMLIVPAANDSIDDADALSLKLSPFNEWLNSVEPEFVTRSYEQASVFETKDRSKGLRVYTKPYTKAATELHVDDRLKIPPHHLPAGRREALLNQLRRRQAREKDPEAGVLIDIDYYWMWPPKETNVKDFIESGMRASEKALAALARGKTP